MQTGLETTTSRLEIVTRELAITRERLDTAEQELYKSEIERKVILRELRLRDYIIESIHKSTSWRISAPIRLVGDTLKSRSAIGYLLSVVLRLLPKLFRERSLKQRSKVATIPECTEWLFRQLTRQ